MKNAKITPIKTKEEKLAQIFNSLEKAKHELAELVEQYDKEGTDSEKTDILTEAMDALTDACEGIEEAVETL